MTIKRVVLLVFIFSLLGLSGYFLSDKILKRQKKKEAYSSIPDFQLLDIQGNRISGKSLKKHSFVMFVYFCPDCDLCVNELTEISLHQSALETGQMVFFSSLSSDSTSRFLKEIDFVPASNMLFLSDEKESLCSQLEVRMSPSIYFYRKGKLHKRFEGSVKIETIIQFFSENNELN